MVRLVAGAAIASVTLTAAVATAKDFSGRITYVQRYANPKTGAAMTEFGTRPLDRVQIYETDGHNYRSFNEHGRLVQLYRAEENAYYFVQDGKATKRDAGEATAEFVAVHHDGEPVTVLGRRCRRIDIETSHGSDTFFFDPAGPHVDAAAFRRHALGSWNRYLQEAGGALALKIISRSVAFTMTIEATSIVEASFSASDFQLTTAMKGPRTSPAPATKRNAR